MENPFKKLIEEWKKASPKEKLFIVGAAASIVAVALYLHNKTSSSSLAGTGTTGLPSSLSPGTGGTTGTTGTTPTNFPVQGTPIINPNPPGDTGSNPPVYNPPTYYGPPDTGSPPVGQPAGTIYPNYSPGAAVQGGTFGRTSYTQQQHQGTLNYPAQSIAASVLGGSFGRNTTTQGKHKGTIPTTPTPPTTYPSGFGSGYAPRFHPQPTAAATVYAATRHAQASVQPTQTQQAAPPPVRKPRAF